MKLYTGEQLHNTVIAVSNCLDDINLGMAQEKIEKHLKALQPIELPSDEEIEESETDSPYDGIDEYNYGFIDGANWVKEFILNQNK